jgi:hypothetical protein
MDIKTYNVRVQVEMIADFTVESINEKMAEKGAELAVDVSITQMLSHTESPLSQYVKNYAVRCIEVNEYAE